MRIDKICNYVEKLKKEYQTNDVRELCERRGFIVSESFMGNSDNSCKGFALKAFGKIAITINTELNPKMKELVLAHELAHAELHCEDNAVNPFCDACIFDIAGSREYEANIFAAEFLIDDTVILPLLQDGLTIYEVSQELGYPIEFIDFKIRILKNKGYDIDVPYIADSCFLKSVAQ